MCFLSQFWCSFMGTSHRASPVQGCGTSRCGVWCCYEQFNTTHTKHVSRLLQRINERYEHQTSGFEGLFGVWTLFFCKGGGGEWGLEIFWKIFILWKILAGIFFRDS